MLVALNAMTHSNNVIKLRYDKVQHTYKCIHWGLTLVSGNIHVVNWDVSFGVQKAVYVFRRCQVQLASLMTQNQFIYFVSEVAVCVKGYEWFSFIAIFLSMIDRWNWLKGITHIDKPTENYHLFLWSPSLYLFFNFIVFFGFLTHSFTVLVWAK